MNSLSDKLQTSMSVGLVREDYCDPLVVWLCWFFTFLKVLHCCVCIWSTCSLYLLPSLVCPNSDVFTNGIAANSPLDIWTSTKSLSSMGYSLNQCLLGAPRLCWRGTGASSQATAESTARNEVHLPMTWCTAGQDSSSYQCRVLDTTAS